MYQMSHKSKDIFLCKDDLKKKITLTLNNYVDILTHSGYKNEDK